MDVSSDQRRSGTVGDDGAGRTSVAMEPDVSALGAMRAHVARWLRTDDYDADVVDRVTLVASEMASDALHRCDGVNPVLIDLRHTHTLLVVDVTYHLAAHPAAGSGDEARGPGAEPSELDVVGHLVDRLTTDDGGRRVTTRSTFYLPGAA